MKWKFTPAIAAFFCAMSVFALDETKKPDRSEGLLVDHETAVQKCGVGNYLFRYMKDGCTPKTAYSGWSEYESMANYPIYDDTMRTTASSADFAASSDAMVYYPLGVTALSGDRKDELDETAEYLKKNPSASVDILGYADATGGVAVSEKVARERARKARDYLLASGVNASQVHIVTPAEPVSDNFDNAIDRRTELRLQRVAE